MNKPRSTLGVYECASPTINPQSVIGEFFVLICLANMLNYGISLVFWAPFSLKILLEESPPTRAKQVQVVSLI